MENHHFSVKNIRQQTHQYMVDLLLVHVHLLPRVYPFVAADDPKCLPFSADNSPIATADGYHWLTILIEDITAFMVVIGSEIHQL